MPQHGPAGNIHAEAPTKFIDIKQALGDNLRGMTPDSLAFFLGSQIPPAEGTGIDPRRIPFNDIPPQLRDQRQHSLAVGGQNQPFSIFDAISNVRQQKAVNQ